MGAPGCDDAPVVEIPLAAKAKRLTMIYPYYENPLFLRRQIAGWRAWPRDLVDQVSLIVADDGSPVPAEIILKEAIAEGGLLPLYTSLYRIDVDVRWNWLAARNLAAWHAPAFDWLLLTDMDHVVPAETLRTCVYGVHDAGTIYRFSRIGTKTHPHPNSWFMTREMFWRVGGYDESLSGHYGTDGEYRRRCVATAPIRIMTVPLELHEHEGDASTTRYLRKQPEDAAAKQMIKARGRKWRPRVLSFPYHEVVL